VDIGEKPETVQAFARSRGLTFPILLDETGIVAQGYHVRSIPMSFLIDREGLVQTARRGAIREQDKDAIGRWVEASP
jgi:peroxiredoxin